MRKHTPVSQRILFEDNHLIAINKLPSEIVQGDKTGDLPLSEEVKEYIRKKYHKPGNVFTGVIHRLDRPVSGVVVFAKTGKALTRMNELVKNREIKKTYWAIVKNRPQQDEALLTHFLVRNERKNKSFVTKNKQEGSKEAILSYRLIASSKDYFLLETDLQTGRHHQIRAQLAAIGCPIKGDLKYGYPRSNKDASISLHARSVEFVHPVKKEAFIITSEPPDDVLWKYFVNSLGKAGK
ncbi:MAG: RNA pseudouridine synthase [Bacteroidales bacterium]|nr:RNA pseudouridine synthase [Bacteroidales bacterium]MCF6341580.1 RNA pseudouridine synthase [Bacteroidales bacterium]